MLLLQAEEIKKIICLFTKNGNMITLSEKKCHFVNLLTLESGIDVGQGISGGPGKFGKKNKLRALNKRRALDKRRA